MEFHTAHSLLRVHGLSDIPRRPNALRRRFDAFLDRMREAAQRHLDRERLMAMSERELADIGLLRADLIAADSRAAWPFGRKSGGPANA